MDTEKIKKRLNIHVKRRIQEQVETTEIPESSSYGSTIVKSEYYVTEYVTENCKIVSACSTSTENSSSTEPSSPTTHQRQSPRVQSVKTPTSITPTRSKSTTPSTPVTLTPSSSSSAKSPKKSKITRRQLNSSTESINANNNNEGETDGYFGDRCPERKLDILSIVLNEKKKMLMQDPEVITFLNDIISKYNQLKDN